LELWLVRHGESTWNRERRFQGQRDAPLSDRGRAQAEALARTLAGAPFDALYASPLARARDTAARCGQVLDLAVQPIPDLREIGLGDWEGLEIETVKARFGEGYRRWLETPVDHPPPGGETIDALRTRVTAAIEAIRRRHPAGRVLVVSHGAALAAFLLGILQLGPNAIWQVQLDNAAVTRLAFPDGRLLDLNDVRHLAALGAASTT
jgi:broad specificity phosphatase PhoE